MAEAAVDQRTLFVFVHIPKTAGTTLTSVLSMNEPGPRSRALGNVFKGGGGVKQGVRFVRLRDEKGALDLEGVMVLTGHFPLGVREQLPKDRDLRFFTFLREPADRTLSHYFQIRESAERDRATGRERSKQESFGLRPLPPEPTLEDALEGGYIHDNLHTRMLSGDLEPFGEVNDEVLERAKRNLREELVFFGLTERFDESLVLAKQRLGFRGILYRSSGRVNTARPRGDEVPKELVRAAEHCNRYDIELYRYARELFDSAPERGGLEFEVELAALRAAKAEGEIEADAPPPPGFDGGEQAWRMLLQARAMSQRLEWERRRHRIPHVSATVQDEARENELKAARSRAKKLEQEVERLRVPRSMTKKLEREVERLRGASSRAKKLEQEVERLKIDSSRRTKELEQEVERLRTDSSRRMKALKYKVERLRGASSRTKELEQEVERLKVASSRRTKELKDKGGAAQGRPLEEG